MAFTMTLETPVAQPTGPPLPLTITFSQTLDPDRAVVSATSGSPPVTRMSMYNRAEARAIGRWYLDWSESVGV